ncbi:MAG TPA: aspartyl protease family protein [Longimicrobium sp.]
MAQFTLQLDPANGPVLTAVVGVSIARGDALMAAGQPIPEGISIRALIDTGASCTCVDPAVLDRLNLAPTGFVSVHTPSTGGAPHQAEQYDVSLIIPGAGPHHVPLAIPAVPVMATELSLQGIDALIGRDVLRECVLIYNGSVGMFTIAF